MSANDKQIGGDHYKSGYQHWDFVIETQMHYLIGCATKYITRHRNKNGKQDLEKSIHYIEKFLQSASGVKGIRAFFPWVDKKEGVFVNARYPEHNLQFRRLVEYFCVSNDLHEDDAEIITYICTQPVDYFQANLIPKIKAMVEQYDEDEETKNIHVGEE